MKRYIALMSVCLLAGNLLWAQTDFVLSEQLFSRIAVNPAGTGNSENVNIFSVNRFQYAGMQDAPFTTLLNVQTYFDKARSGVGVSVSYDQSGAAYHQVQAKAVYAFHLNLGERHLLSLGLGLGIINKQFDPSQYILEDDTERGEGFPDRYQNQTHFDASFGIEYSNPYLLIGLSMTHIPGFFYPKTTLTDLPNYYAYARGSIPCGRAFKLSPALTYFYTGQFHVIDANVTGFIGDYVWVGLGYRTETTGYAMVGFEWQWLRIGYCFDLNFGKLSNLAWTSHEFMISFNIPTKNKKNLDLWQ